VLVPERVLTGAWPRTFRLSLLRKDVAIAGDLLAELNLPADMLQLARKLLAQAEAGLDGGADYLEAIRWIEQQGGVEVRG